MYLIYTDRFGLREIPKLPAFLPIGAYIRQGTGSDWHTRRATRYDKFKWKSLSSEELPNKVKTEALLMGISL